MFSVCFQTCYFLVSFVQRESEEDLSFHLAYVTWNNLPSYLVIKVALDEIIHCIILNWLKLLERLTPMRGPQFLFPSMSFPIVLYPERQTKRPTATEQHILLVWEQGLSVILYSSNLQYNITKNNIYFIPYISVYYIFRFKISNNLHIIEVNMNDEMNFVCPYYSDTGLDPNTMSIISSTG